MFSRSLDCGQTWSTPMKLSESNSINQGTNIAIDPASGAVYVTWRRFATSSQTGRDRRREVDRLRQDLPVQEHEGRRDDRALRPGDDRDRSSGRTRCRRSPSRSTRRNVAASTSAGRSATRSTGDSRIVISTSTDGSTWSAPAPVDAAPLTDDFGGTLQSRAPVHAAADVRGGPASARLLRPAPRPHARLPHPQQPVRAGRPGALLPRPAAIRRASCPAIPSRSSRSDLDDATLTTRRHTVDLRVAEAAPAAFADFTSSTVSQYRFGVRSLDDFGDPITTPTGLDAAAGQRPEPPALLAGHAAVPGRLHRHRRVQSSRRTERPAGSFNTSRRAR